MRALNYHCIYAGRSLCQLRLEKLHKYTIYYINGKLICAKTTFCALECGFYEKNAIFAVLLTSLAKRS
jgi:hypothetical protein